MKEASKRVLEDLVAVALGDTAEALRLAIMRCAEKNVRCGLGNSPAAAGAMMVTCHEEYKRRCAAIESGVKRFLNESKLDVYAGLEDELKEYVAAEMSRARDGLSEKMEQCQHQFGGPGKPAFEEVVGAERARIESEVGLAVHSLRESKRQERRSAIQKWIWGIVGTVVGAAAIWILRLN